MKLPPSSPFSGYHEDDKSIERDNDIFNYPSPEPSSSIGRQSSSPVQQVSEKNILKHSVNSYILSIANDDGRQFTIGRKRSICDIVLPKLPHISRQHVFVQYLSHRNQLKITCNGANTISILLGKKIPFVLIKTEKINEFILDSNVQNCNPEDIHYLDAFTLRSKDVVFMPVIRNISVCVSNIKTHINVYIPSPKKSNISPIDSDISTDTDEDSRVIRFNEESLTTRNFATPSKTLIPVPQSPSTGKILQSVSETINSNVSVPQKPEKVTPFNKGFVVPEPSTPIKRSCEIRADLNNVTPVPIRKKPKLDKLKHNDNKLNDKDQSNSTVLGNSGRLKFFDTYTEKSKEVDTSNLDIDNFKIAEAVINFLAFGKIKQVPLSNLLHVNSFTSKLNKHELRSILASVECLEVIHRDDRASSGKLLDEEYFYNVEKDKNRDRKDAVIMLKGSNSALRSCRRKHKQYYWKKVK